MPNYETLYHLLFNSITDALEALDRQEYPVVRDILRETQQKAEDIYISESPL